MTSDIAICVLEYLLFHEQLGAAQGNDFRSPVKLTFQALLAAGLPSGELNSFPHVKNMVAWHTISQALSKQQPSYALAAIRKLECHDIIALDTAKQELCIFSMLNAIRANRSVEETLNEVSTVLNGSVQVKTYILMCLRRVAEKM